MGLEIERKWLVKSLIGLTPIESYNIVQGYLISSKKESLRIRQVEQGRQYKYFLTIKSGSGIVRNETEIGITSEMFDVLYPLTKGKRIVKNRSVIKIEQDLYAEVDFFNGLDLALVEVEFEDEKQANGFIAPDWFGEEVTNDSKYVNANLAN